MGKHDSFDVRPIVSLEQMKKYDHLLHKAFKVYVINYNAIAKKRGGIMLVDDMNKIIDNTVNFYSETTQIEKNVIEGFCEMIMAMLKEYGNSVNCFNAVRKMFYWR